MQVENLLNGDPSRGPVVMMMVSSDGYMWSVSKHLTNTKAKIAEYEIRVSKGDICIWST